MISRRTHQGDSDVRQQEDEEEEDCNRPQQHQPGLERGAGVQPPQGPPGLHRARGLRLPRQQAGQRRAHRQGASVT